MRNVLQLLHKNPVYGLFCLSQLISSIGSGLTQVAVYGSLARSNANPIWFTAAFAITLLPSLLASKLGESLFKRIQGGKLLLYSNLISALLLVPAIRAGEQTNPPLLILAEFVGAMSIAFAYPIQQSLIKRLFEGESLVVCLKLDTALFSSQVVLGVGIGTLLFGRFGVRNYLILDTLTYLLAGLAISAVSTLLPLNCPVPQQEGAPASAPIRLSTPERKQAYRALPLLAFCTTPAISLLPAIGSRFASSYSPALIFLFAKCVGQVIGPFCTPSRIYQTNGSKAESRFWILNIIFVVFYCTLPHIPTLWAAALTIFLAHTLSNITYSVSVYQLQTTFSESEISSVSARTYRLQLLVMVLLSLITGFLTQWIPVEVCFALPLMAIAAVRFMSPIAPGTLSHARAISYQNSKDPSNRSSAKSKAVMLR